MLVVKIPLEIKTRIKLYVFKLSMNLSSRHITYLHRIYRTYLGRPFTLD